MQRAFRQLVTFAVMLSMLPGWTEIAENIAHLLEDGHAHHLVSHEHDDEVHHAIGEAEHGCTPVSHVCSCHVSMPAVLTRRQDAAERHPVATSDAPLRRDHLLVTRSTAPPVPPPRA